MRLREVRIYSNLTAQQAQDIINQEIRACAEYNDVSVNFDLKIENTIASEYHGYSDTRYTLILYFYDLTIE